MEAAQWGKQTLRVSVLLNLLPHRKQAPAHGYASRCLRVALGMLLTLLRFSELPLNTSLSCLSSDWL